MTDRMFDFLSGDPDEILTYKDIGVLPWWTDDTLKVRFWRPLSAITHVLDYALWPERSEWMHIHNVAWLALLIGSTAALYRRLITMPLVAGLAALLYALDDAHGMPVAFLANRNALVATSFGVLSLWCHDRFRRDGWTPGMVLSPLAFLAALLGGESGIGAAPYLLGYALFLERKSGVARFASIAPHALVGIAWLAAYKMSGYGASGSGFYLDPIAEPAAWFAQSLIRAPLLLLGQWFLPPSSFAFAWNEAQTFGVAIFGVAFLGVLFLFLRPLLREDATARFFTFGMLLSVVPITAVFPHDRLLFFVGIGATGLLAMLLVRLFDRSLAPPTGRAFAWVLVVVHVVLAAGLQLMMNASVAAQEPHYADAPRSLPEDSRLESQRLLIVNHPMTFYGQYTLLIPRFDGRPAPETMLMLAPGDTRLVVERLSKDTLSIEAESGWMGTPFDGLYRARTRPFPMDYRVTLSDVRIAVVTWMEDGRPRKVRFTFERALEDESFRWVRFEDGRYVPFELPRVGEQSTLEAVPFDILSPDATTSSYSSAASKSDHGERRPAAASDCHPELDRAPRAVSVWGLVDEVKHVIGRGEAMLGHGFVLGRFFPLPSLLGRRKLHQHDSRIGRFALQNLRRIRDAQELPPKRLRCGAHDGEVLLKPLHVVHAPEHDYISRHPLPPSRRVYPGDGGGDSL